MTPPAVGLSAQAMPPATFASQSDAESWLGEHWRALAETGVAEVALIDGARVRYDLTLSA